MNSLIRSNILSPTQIPIYPPLPITPQQTTSINLGELIQPFITFMIVMLMMKLMMAIIKTPTSELLKLPERALEKLRGISKPAEKQKPTPAPVEENLEAKKLTLEAKGREIAEQVGESINFLKLDKGWQQKYATVRYWFKDIEGHEIVATDIDELKWKLSR